MQYLTTGILEDLELDWQPRDFRCGSDKNFGFYEAGFLANSNPSSMGVVKKSIIAIPSGLWMPEQYRKKTDQIFSVVGGIGNLFTRDYKGDEQSLHRLSLSSGPFRIPPGELHSFYNDELEDFYLLRISFLERENGKDPEKDIVYLE